MTDKILKSRESDFKIIGFLSIGAFAIGSAAILIRMADANPIVIAAYRMLVAFVVVIAVSRLKGQSFDTRVGIKDWILLLVSGLFLASHFALWITSLQMTSIANSVFLVTTTPLFVLVGAHFKGDRATWAVAFAVLVTIAGGVVLGIGDPSNGGNSIRGDLLAVAGAIAMAGNLLIGRHLRPRIDLTSYITIVYLTAFLVLILCVLITRAPFLGLPIETYGWIFLAGLIPQAVGHTTLNWALAHVSATVVALVTRIEPVIAILLASIFLNEVPHWTVIPGGLLLLLGVVFAFRFEMTKAR
ncbi:MAG: EamA family transporter [Chloroflexi bacterium]|nr:EamA family transporter [Chloroflexota bacterium]